MPKRHLINLIVLSFILIFASSMYHFETHAYETATVYVNPPEITGLMLGQDFTVDVSVASVTNLAGWEFRLYFPSRVIHVLDAEEGPFLEDVGNTIFIKESDYVKITNTYNATHGVVPLACGLIGGGSADGSGILATISFTVVGVGQALLHLPQNQTKLGDHTPPPTGPIPIPHTTVDGLVRIGGNDIAVTNVQLTKTITNDTTTPINVTVQNNGDYASTFDVTLYYDENEIQTQPVTDLTPETSLALTFTWDTTPVPKGNYTIKAYAHPIAGEVLVENNLLIAGWIKETIMGDVNGDDQVNILDISLVAIAFGARPTDTRWLPNADINNDEIINILDISTVAIHFGEVDP